MNTTIPADWPNEEEREILRTTFVRLIPASETVSEGLYRKLFELAPSLRPLFPENMVSQQEKLVQMLAVSIDMLDAPEAFRQGCEDLGARHVGYGAVPAHYPVVGQLPCGRAWSGD